MYSGKAIYNPAGKAGEYARWACNLHVGCSNSCDYCYCRRGVLGSVMGGPRATLKKSLVDEENAFAVFVRELAINIEKIREAGGLFFSFSTDPLLPETAGLTLRCVSHAVSEGVPCRLLTKCIGWVWDRDSIGRFNQLDKDMVALGFSLTGMDDMEKGPTVASNLERLAMLESFHKQGVRTFASFEPIIDVKRAKRLFVKSLGFCDHYMFGLLSGKKDYDRVELEKFSRDVTSALEQSGVPAYWKHSFRCAVGHKIDSPVTVGEDYDIFRGSRAV